MWVFIYIPDDEDEYFKPPSTSEKLSRGDVPSYCGDDDDANISTPDEWLDVFILAITWSREEDNLPAHNYYSTFIFV
jgi:hypothetical protein